MSLPGRIIESFPDIVPRGTIAIESEAHTFRVLTDEQGNDSPKTIYTLRKAPISRVDDVVAQIGGASKSLTKGTDYQVVDDDGDGEDDAIEFSNSSAYPDDDSTFFVDYVAESVVSRYADAHDADLDDVSDRVDTSIESRQVDGASGDDLDRIGALFGKLGKRRGRNDQDYRQFLTSIVQSFRGRGTKQGMKFAIAAGIGTDPSNVTITEDYQNVGYEISLSDVNTDFVTAVVEDMAQLADPSGVELLTPPLIVVEGGAVDVVPTETTTSSTSGLGSNTLTLDGSSSLQ